MERIKLCRRPMVCGVAVGLAALCASGAAAGLVIDDFSSTGDPSPWPLVASDTIGIVSAFESGLGGTIGGTRTSDLSADVITVMGLDNVTATVTDGILDYDASAGASGALSLFYGSTDLDADFSAGVAFEIEFLEFDYANLMSLDVTITIADSDSTASLGLSLTSPGAQVASFDLASFSGIGDIDLSDVDSVEVVFDSGLGADFRVEGITLTVPAPGALALIGLAGLAGRRRRRA